MSLSRCHYVALNSGLTGMCAKRKGTDQVQDPKGKSECAEVALV